LSVAAAAALVGREAGLFLVADPVAVGEAPKAALQIEREPAGELGMGVVIPEAIAPTQSLDVGDEIPDPPVLR
jgi:hypothetical protein